MREAYVHLRNVAAEIAREQRFMPGEPRWHVRAIKGNGGFLARTTIVAPPVTVLEISYKPDARTSQAYAFWCGFRRPTAKQWAKWTMDAELWPSAELAARIRRNRDIPQWLLDAVFPEAENA